MEKEVRKVCRQMALLRAKADTMNALREDWLSRQQCNLKINRMSSLSNKMLEQETKEFKN